MPETPINIYLVGAGVLLLVTLLSWLAKAMFTRFNQLRESNNLLATSMADMSERLLSLEQNLRRRHRELEGIRAEFALRDSRASVPNVDYNEAIKQASGGSDAYTLCENFGISDAEAQLLTAVYGPEKHQQRKESGKA